MPTVCQTCGAVLAPDSSPAGLCPACLFTQVLSDLGDDPGGSDPPEGEGEPSGLIAGSTFGPFRIEAVLGKGGMSTVYRAYETTLDRVVALKVLPPEFLHDDTFARRFQQEARVVTALEHPHIVPLYATGIEGGIPWMSMRLLAGGDLRALVDGGRLDVNRTVEILQATASALDYGHARGVIHRDVKPSNILLDQAGHVCVSDFGLAHLMERSLIHTRTGVIAGTPHYMAPEQGLGKGVDHLADIYSLGIVAYEMLTGRPPYDADSPVAVLMKHATEPLPVPSKELVPEALVPVLRKALAKEPRDRWPTATEFVSALEKSVATPSVARGIAPVAAGVAGLAVAAAIGVLVFAPPTRSTDADPERTVDTPAPELPVEAVPEIAPLGQPDTRPIVASTSRPASRGAVAQPAPAAPIPAQAAPVLPGRGRTTPPVTTTRAVEPDPSSLNPSAVDQTDASPASAGRAALAPAPVPGNNPTVEATNPTAPAPLEDTVSQPVRLRTISPTYPALARAAQIEGDVLLQVVVGPDGSVTEVEVFRSVHPLLDAAARAAVLQYSYSPGLRNGAPDTFGVQVTVSFRLE